MSLYIFFYCQANLESLCQRVNAQSVFFQFVFFDKMLEVIL